MNLGWFAVNRVWTSSGARGFFGHWDEYRYHKYWRRLGLDYAGTTFVAKTVTTNSRLGNMLLDVRHRPLRWYPDCIVVKPFQGVVLNAVGLSNPGISQLLTHDYWQQRTEPFLLSFSATGDTAAERLDDTEQFAGILQGGLGGWAAPIGLQVNFSCPNVGHVREPGELNDALDILGELTQRVSGYIERRPVPLVPKFNALEPPEVVLGAAEHAAVAGLAGSNTIPWGQEPGLIDWVGLFGSLESPLRGRGYGDGGLSGAPLLPLSINWLSRLRGHTSKPLIGGGGILSVRDAMLTTAAGASAVELGVVGMLRPRRVRAITRWVQMHVGDGGL